MIFIKRSCKAFTLLEIIITILVIGVISSFAIPQFQKIITTYKVKRMLMDIDMIDGLLDMYCVKFSNFGGPSYVPPSSFFGNGEGASSSAIAAQKFLEGLNYPEGDGPDFWYLMGATVDFHTTFVGTTPDCWSGYLMEHGRQKEFVGGSWTGGWDVWWDVDKEHPMGPILYKLLLEKGVPAGDIDYD